MQLISLQPNPPTPAAQQSPTRQLYPSTRLDQLYLASQQPLAERLQQHVTQLASFDRCFENPNGLNQAANYIKQAMEGMGLQVTGQPFQVNGNTYKNLIVSFGPPNADRYIIGAHYDVCAYEQDVTEYQQATIQDRINLGKQGIDLRRTGSRRYPNMPGADDNASGVAVLIELARQLKQDSQQLNKRIDLVAFTLEEPPNFGTPDMGSAVHANSIASETPKTVGMLSLEMLGYYDDTPGSQKFPVGFLKHIFGDKGDFLAVIGMLGSTSWVKQVKNQLKQTSLIPIKWLSAPKLVPGIDFSDHRNYAKLGIPAAMLTDTAFYRNPNYHTREDKPETLDYNRMASITGDIVKFVEKLNQ